MLEKPSAVLDVASSKPVIGLTIAPVNPFTVPIRNPETPSD